MRSSVEVLDGNKVKVVVEVEEAEFEKDVDAAFQRLAREIRLPGFRPGKAPRKVLEARIGNSYARDEAFREALPSYYSEAVKEHEVDVIAPPEIDITDGRETGPVSFDAVVEVRPSISISGYDSLEIEVTAPKIDDDDIDEGVDRMRAGFGELEAVNRPGKDGDRAAIDIETYHGDEPIAGLTTDEYVYEIGSTAAGIAEIDEQLRGASAGDELAFSAEHPDPDEDEPLDITIRVREIQEMVLPEPTDEWVAENSEFETLAELRDNLRQRLLTGRIMGARSQRANRIAEALIGLVDDDHVPPAMVDLEVENRAEELASRIQHQGANFQQYLEITGQTQEDVVAGLRNDAAAASKIDLALRAIVDAEQLEVTDSEIDAEIAGVAERVERTADEIRADFIESGRMLSLRWGLLKSKALQWVTDRANLVDEDGQPVSPDALELPSQDETGEDDQ